MIKVTQFEVIHFEGPIIDETGKELRREIVLLYGLGEDGTIYEMTAGKWYACPIDEAHMGVIPSQPSKERSDNG
jgi:hypothetical protein